VCRFRCTTRSTTTESKNTAPPPLYRQRVCTFKILSCWKTALRCTGAPLSAKLFPGVQVSSHCAQYGYRVEYSDGDAEDLWLESLCELRLRDPAGLVDRAVAKHFAGHGRFEGRVASFEPQSVFFVEYSDGDAEHLGAAQLLRILLPARQPKKRRRKK